MILSELRLNPHITSLIFVFLLFLMLMRPPLASAQGISGDLLSGSSFERNGEILGTVHLDSGDLPVGQITITVRSLALGISRTVLSDFDGTFRVRGLSPGTYQVIAEAQGYHSAYATTQVNGFSSDISLSLKPSHPASSSASGSSISIRELKIPGKARDEYQRGLDSLTKQDVAGSIAHLEKAIKISPGYYEAYYHIGVAEIRLNHAQEAMDAFQKAIDLSDGRFAMAQFAYGLLLSDRGKPEEGERIIRAGLETKPDAPDGHFFLSIALYKQNRLDESEKSVREALLRKPNLADGYLILSDIHAKRNDYQSQLQDLDTFLKLAPNAPQAEKIRQIREVVERLATSSSTGSAVAQSDHAQP